MITYLVQDFVLGIFNFFYLPFFLSAVFSSILWLALIVCYLVGRYFMFKKMGLPAWQGLIPFYGILKMSSKTWSLMLCWLMIATFAIWGFFDYLSYMVFENPFIGYFAYQIFICNGVCLLFALGMWFWCQHCVAKSFGKSVGWSFGLFFVSEIFNLIIGLGSAEYAGNIYAKWNEKRKEKLHASNEEAYKKAFEKKAAREAGDTNSKEAVAREAGDTNSKEAVAREASDTNSKATASSETREPIAAMSITKEKASIATEKSIEVGNETKGTTSTAESSKISASSKTGKSLKRLTAKSKRPKNSDVKQQ